MWPALMLAASRKDKVIGRNKILKVSINTRKGFNHKGAPPGRRLAVKIYGLKIIADKIILNQRIDPKDNVNNKWLVELKTYGINPIKLVVIIITNNGVNKDDIPLILILKVRDSWEDIKLIG